MSAIIFAMITLVGWGTGDIFGGLVARKINGYSSAVFNYLICIIISSFYIPFALPELKLFTPLAIFWLVILLPVGSVPLVTLYEGMRRGNASLVGVVSSSFGAIVSILSVIFLKESLNTNQIISIIMVVIGVTLSSFNFKNFQLKNIITDKGIPYAIVSLLLWSIYFTFVKIPIRQVGWFWPAYISWWSFLPIILYLKIKSIKIELPKDKKTFSYMIINGFLSVAALFSFNLASSKGQSSVVGPIVSTYSALFVLLAYFVFKDRLTKQQILGIIITLIGVISLSLLA